MASRLQEKGKGWVVGVAVPAAGGGTRMGGVRKPFLDLAGEPILLRSLRPFLHHPWVQVVVVALGEEDLLRPPEWLTAADPSRIRLVRGGATRGQSVLAALDALPPEVDVVAVHDAARPLVSRTIIDRCLEAVRADRGVVAGWPAVDTIKEVDGEGRIVRTLPRERIWHAQTPQVFPREMIVRAYREGIGSGLPDTDDAALVERAGGQVVVVPGSASNLKITQPGDLVLAETLLQAGGA